MKIKEWLALKAGDKVRAVATDEVGTVIEPVGEDGTLWVHAPYIRAIPVMDRGEWELVKEEEGVKI